MRGRVALIVAAAAALAACGMFGKKEDARGVAPAGSGVQGTGRVTSGAAGPASGGGAAAGGAGGGLVAWVDPEPPGAQAIAEQVVSAPWNESKRTRLTSEDKTTGLTMSMTTLVDTKTGLQGFRTAVAAAQTTLDQKLTRLGAEVTGTEVTIRLPGSVLFDFDSAQIRPDAERTLSEVVEVINGYAKRPVRVEGHTDSIASDDYNQKLSERRAAAVRAWLAAKGVEGARLTPRGWGESKPVADNATADGRQRNRRVEVIIEKGR
jgi:outer membrane protein OmpA-like peptidoglycan-associated protein